MDVLIICVGILSLLMSTVLAMAYQVCFETDIILAYCNPVWLFKNTKLNKFGSICVSTILTISILPFALCYGIYKIIYSIFTCRMNPSNESEFDEFLNY